MLHINSHFCLIQSQILTVYLCKSKSISKVQLLNMFFLNLNKNSATLKVQKYGFGRNFPVKSISQNEKRTSQNLIFLFPFEIPIFNSMSNVVILS